ncbi:hypothetical protein F5Y05DRAFT_14349 [Hypoxylon sp. FL0543]|nr:hypothetical protein F5Y05DRAFT_14349 [Hypoxylon sp. FL0543]
MADKNEQPISASERKSRKKRVRLSCIECRKKKLSCDRERPCQRCVRSGRPAQCSFETVAEQPCARQQEQQIQELKTEVAELKALLSEIRSTRVGEEDRGSLSAIHHAESSQSSMLNGRAQETEFLPDSGCVVENPPLIDGSQTSPTISPGDMLPQNSNHVAATELVDPRDRLPQGYYNRHALFQFFREVRELFPFIRETAIEWLKPLGVSLSKNKSTRSHRNKTSLFHGHTVLENFLPPKDDTDILVSVYLDGAEQLHRIVHIPTFRREYAEFWEPQRARHPAMTTLVLAMISVSTCATPDSTDATSIATKYRAVSQQWISACEEWLKEQSLKNRKLVYYQISCLVYMAKRMNIIDKKKWWKETSSLIQDAIIDGLHCDPSPTTNTPYAIEMKRRIWAVLRELDLQNSFECGLPTFLHNIDSDVAPPGNLDDDDFSQSSKKIPAPKPTDHYTFTSYQVQSSRSWSLRLEISQSLFSGKSSKALCYDDVLRYTHEVTQAIDAIPSWETDARDQNRLNLPTLAHAFLLLQLKTCILALHRPYLHRKDGKYWLSETVCYHISRDILLLNSKLASSGCQSLTFIREDLLLASLSLVRITMLQPKDSSSLIMANSQSTIDLLEACVPFMEDMHLRCCCSELWCFITMYAAIMLLKIYLGKESREQAKASCARRFLDLHYKQLERQRMSSPDQDCLTPSNPSGDINVPDCQPATSGGPAFPAPEWLDSNYPELSIDSFDFDVNMDSAWDAWEPLFSM